MEFELRTVLLVVGLVVIAAILIHGLIGIRKANKPVDLSGVDLSEEDDCGNLIRDGSGFDRHGVGVARVIANEADDSGEISVQQKSLATDPELVEDVAIELDIAAVPAMMVDDQAIDFDISLDCGVQEPTIGSETLAIEPEEAVFDSPIHCKKPVTAVVPDPAKHNADASEPQLEALSEPSAVNEPEIEPMDVLVLNVVATEGEEINGAQLLPILLTLGFKFGEMNIFHRHVSSDGRGDVLFSLANMVKPGIFDIDNMEQFTTTGVSLFMTLPKKQSNIETFNLMLNASAKIAEEISGQVLDGNRSTLTNQLTKHYVERIRDVERNLLTANK